MNHPFFAIGFPHGWELIAICLIIVLLFGADKIPKLAKGLGKSLGEFKKAKEDFEKEIHAAAAEPESPKIEDKPRVTPAGSVPVADEPAKKL